jgi:beta-phosphoglucomutase
MSAPRAVLWDMDGTLIDSEQLHWFSWRDTLKNEGVSINYEQFLAAFGRRDDAFLPEWLGSGASSSHCTSR